MKNIKSKNILILIFLLTILIIGIVIFSNSMANKVINISATIKDSKEELKDETIKITATGDEDGSYYITLPEEINGIKVTKYTMEEAVITEETVIKDDEEIIDSSKDTENTNNIEEKGKIEETSEQSDTEKIEENELTETKEITEKEESSEENVEVVKKESKVKSTKKPGDKVCLTAEQIKNKEIEIVAKYDSKEVEDGLVLYNKILEEEKDDRNIKLEGYMPYDSTVIIEDVKEEDIEENIDPFLIRNVNLKVAYDIKIMENDVEYDPSQYDENIKVTITDIKKSDKNEYRVVHIDEENAEEVTSVKEDGEDITFNAESFSIYAVLEDTEVDLVTYAALAEADANAKSWDGSIAEKYKFGDGSKQNPYLITNGSELAYLAENVNNGENYEGKYFQLASDIDLGSKSWTPIGNTNNSFRGIFDGAGHSIYNINISINSNPSGIQSYGLFGTIGGGSQRTVIKNLELDDAQISIGGSGNVSSGGWHIGTLVGTMYNNSEVINNIVNGSTISDNGNISIRSADVQYAVGGLVGYVTNTQNSTGDPGGQNRYKIENCFVNTKIDLSNEVYEGALGGLFGRENSDAQYHTGGVVGTIRSQPIWPDNCLYAGTIDSNGYIGPIFAALINNTNYDDTDNYETLWNGNDAGNLTMNSYYTSFAANGTAFNATVTSGTSTNRVSSSGWGFDIGSVQGVNKGRYVSNIQTRLDSFNSYASDAYVKWNYSNNTYSFADRFTVSLNDSNKPIYKIEVDNEYSAGPYLYTWYLDGEIVEELKDKTEIKQEKSWDRDYNYTVVVYDGEYFSVLDFTIEKLSLFIEFDINESNDTVTARLAGEALPYIDLNDYTYQWFTLDIAGLNQEEIEGETSLTLDNLVEGQEYQLVATNNTNYSLNVTGSFIYGDRNVVYVDYENGNDNRDGRTPETAVKTMQTGYSKLDSNAGREANVIVVMGTYTSTSFFNYDDESSYASRYRKNATITGIYGGVDYEARLYFYGGSGSYRYINGDTTMQYMELYGNRDQMYLYLQGYSFTMGEGITMVNYATSNRNQGLLGSRAPAFHMICGWCQYNRTNLPRNNPEILIKSGTYGRIIGGGSPGTSSGQGQTTSKDFTGSANEHFNINITIDIKNSTTSSDYDYDVNLLTGGSAAGNNYSDVTHNIKNGTVGRLIGGSIGDSQTIPRNWRYPCNTFIGTTTINVTGGTVTELYGGCLGRNMGAVNTSGSINNNYRGNTCDSYFYGTININISGGQILNNIYGAGAGGVTGYSQNSSDPYKSYGQGYDTSVNVNVTGGTISGNIYGGGYGYTEYLNANVTAQDGGSLYGNSSIKVSGSPTINGDIYAAGRGYDMSSKPELAQMEGNSVVNISGTPTINGTIFAAGAGLARYSEMAKLIGTSTTNIYSDLSSDVYGGGNNAKVEGSTNINVESGTHTGSIYGGGNLGIIDGDTNTNINGGNNNRIFGGGNEAEVTTSNVNITGGHTTEVYAGGNSASVNTTNTNILGGEVETLYGGSNQTGNVEETNITGTSGTVNNIFGGNNIGGITNNANVNIDGSTITEAVYGGGNRVNTRTSIVNLISTGNNIPYIYGGGNEAAVEDPYVYVKGGKAQNVFGGSNTNGTINQSNVEMTGGTIENIYGGNNHGGTTINTTVKINGGNVTKAVYGGGNEAQSTESNVELLKSDSMIENVYGGGNNAGVNISNVNLKGADVNNIYGGSNLSGDVDESNVDTTLGHAENIYGGNNQGGITQTTNVHIQDGSEIVNVYGGGNNAVVNETNLSINGTVTGSVYGGGNEAGVNTNTNLNIENGTIYQNVYGGGNNGTVSQNTNVHVKDSTINESLYSGGNGAPAIVMGNTNLTIDGTKTKIGQNVFGGGNKAATGTNENRNSVSNVNIVSGDIGKNVYGGANTSVVYGITETNIGYDVVNDSSLEIGDLHIGGTVFGGGEANESGSEIYDFDFISVTDGINIDINGNGYEKFDIDGSIFGSGNASSTSGSSYINIENYGTPEEPKENVSIQRTNIATIKNSSIALSGATDRTNEYSDEYYTISRVDNVKLANNSTLYLNFGANLLKQLDSVLIENGNEVKASVEIDEEGNTIKNVDNRIYMLEGKNLNIATNEQVTAYGKVSGMMFLGLYTNRMNPGQSTGFYGREYNNGDTITDEGMFSSNSYAMAQHMENHDTTVDGFYTNYNNDGNIKVKYIDTTPEDDVYYIWMVGEQLDVTTFEISLTASKYATLGTYELSLTGFSNPNIRFDLTGFSAGLDKDISLVDPDDIKAIADSEAEANSIFGLTMEAGNNGWSSRGETEFYSEDNGSYNGLEKYLKDNSSSTPTLNFCLFHSENISEEKLLGDVKIRLQALVPVDDLNYQIKYIDIIVTMTTALYQDEFYEAAITPGEEYTLFTSTPTTITQNSALSTYYSLYLDDFSNSDYYKDFDKSYSVLISRDANDREYCFPVNTRIVMIDAITNEEYYYVVTEDDVRNNKFEYKLSDFLVMGSTDKHFDETKILDNYYNKEQDILYENYIFHVKFSEADLNQDIENNSLLMELKNQDNETLIGVLGIQRDVMRYNVYKDKDSTIDVSATIDDTAYLGDKIILDISTDFKQQIVNSMTVYDTEYFEQKMGIKLTIFDNNGNQLSLDSLFGINFELDGQKYYPRIDGTTRIKIADKVSNVLSKIQIDTTNNKTLATGTYTIKIESFGSPDGIYYGVEGSAETEVKVTIINSAFGLNLNTNNDDKIVNKEDGMSIDGNNEIITDLKYSSKLDNPKIVAALYRRKYDEVYSKEYELVDLKDYVTNMLEETDNEKEYLIIDNPSEDNTISWNLNTGLKSGTYKLVYKLYDGDNYIGEDSEYIIIK